MKDSILEALAPIFVLGTAVSSPPVLGANVLFARLSSLAPRPICHSGPCCSFSLIILSRCYFSYFSYPLPLSLLRRLGQTRNANTGAALRARNSPTEDHRAVKYICICHLILRLAIMTSGLSNFQWRRCAREISPDESMEKPPFFSFHPPPPPPTPPYNKCRHEAYHRQVLAEARCRIDARDSSMECAKSDGGIAMTTGI